MTNVNRSLTARRSRRQAPIESDVRELAPKGTPAIVRAVKETIAMIDEAQKHDASDTPLIHEGLLAAIRQAGTVTLDPTSLEPRATPFDVAFRELVDVVERAWDDLTLEERVSSLRAAVRIARARIATATGAMSEARRHSAEARSTVERVVLTFPESARRGANLTIAALRRAESALKFSGADAA